MNFMMLHRRPLLRPSRKVPLPSIRPRSLHLVRQRRGLSTLPVAGRRLSKLILTMALALRLWLPTLLPCCELFAPEFLVRA